jgi:signal transduction histidine kinase
MPLSATNPLVEERSDVSYPSNVVEFPVRREDVGRDSVQDIVFALVSAEDFESAMGRLFEWLHRTADVSRVEWWETGELVAAAGSPRARRHNLPLGPTGMLILHGGRFDSIVEAALASLAPVIRRLAADELLTRTAMQLARRNEALEDFAALVAHELKTPLHAALLADDPSGPVENALQLVEALLQAAHHEASESTSASPEEALDQVVEDLKAEVAITAELATTLPLPAQALRVILRNLLSNAVAAGAQHVRVITDRSPGAVLLVVDDDGAGLVDVDRYEAGHGLGLSLSRRIASRFGGRLQLGPNPSGGTRATLEFVEAPR